MRVHPDSLASLNLADGETAILRGDDGESTLPVVTDGRVAPGCCLHSRRIPRDRRDSARRRIQRLVGTGSMIRDLVFFLTGWLPEGIQVTVWVMLKIVAILLPLMGCVAYFTFAERKLIGYMQLRVGPNRVGPKGWLQPIADAAQAVDEGSHRPDPGEPVPVPDRAGAVPCPRPGGLGGDALFRPPRAGGYRRQPALCPGADFHGGLRRHRRRLGLQLEVRIPGRNAVRRPDRGLRDRHGLRPGGGSDGCRQSQPAGNRPRPGRNQLPGAGTGCRCFRLFIVYFHLRRGGNQPCAVRRGGGGIRDRGRASTSSTPAWRSPCFSWPSTPT